MIGINRKDIQAILKAGAKAKGMSTSEFKAEIQATIDNIINSSDIEEQKRFKQYFGNRIPTPEEYIYTITKKTRSAFPASTLRAKRGAGKITADALFGAGRKINALGFPAAAVIVIVRGKDQMASNFPETEEGLLPSSSAIFLKLHPFSMPASIEILSESVKCLPLLDSIKVFINRNSFHVGA